MKFLLVFLLIGNVGMLNAQVWKTLPEGVRVLGYRNVQTSKITSNFNQMGSESSLGREFRIDSKTFNSMMGNIITPGQDVDAEAYNKLLVGEYKVDAQAQVNAHGMGFGYGLTNNLTLFTQIAYYDAHVKTNIKRTAGNTYEQTAEILEKNGGASNGAMAEVLRNMIDGDESTMQSVITNHYGYKPLGDWHGTGYGDMELGLMAKTVDQGIWGVMVYPGVVLPTGREDDPDILQDIGFGDGQFDLFGEAATGYIFNDKLSLGLVGRYTYQAPTDKRLRIPEKGSALSKNSGTFTVKYGDKINLMVNSTYHLNDWISFTPVYRFMYEYPSRYMSDHSEANNLLAENTDKEEHQVQFTTTLSSISPYLKKKFILPAQINMNLVETVGGRNVPKATRYEIEFRMLF